MAASPSPLPPDASRPKILLADDDPHLRRLLQRVLAEEYGIVEAADGHGAVERARAERPDLVILDLKMPNGDGHEVCRILKADPDTRRIPILILRALTDVAEKVISLNLGADDYITKPFQVAELQARVARALERAGQRGMTPRREEAESGGR